MEKQANNKARILGTDVVVWYYHVPVCIDLRMTNSTAVLRSFVELALFFPTNKFVEQINAKLLIN